MKRELLIESNNLNLINEIGLHDATVRHLEYDLKKGMITLDISLSWPGNLIPGAKKAKIIFSDVVLIKNVAYNPWFSNGDWINGLSITQNIESFISMVMESLKGMMNYSSYWKDKTEEEVLNQNDFYVERNLYFKTEIEYHSGDMTEIISKVLLYIEEDN